MIDPKLFMQIDVTTPLRLSPKIFINREDDNYFVIGLYDKDSARKFLTHFLTVIYSFCDWTTPDQLLMVWPPDTANDMLKMIILLQKDSILLKETDYNNALEEITSEFSPEEKSFQNDKAWYEAYKEAIKTIPYDSYVLNCGAKGAGTIARDIAHQGVARVTGTSTSTQNTMVAKSRAKEAGFNNVDFVTCQPNKLSPICYAEKFNVFLPELFCAGIFEDKILEYTLHAKQYLLSDDCLFIPARMNLKMFAYDSGVHRDMVQESKEFEFLYGFKFGSFTHTMSKHIMGIYTRLNPKETKKLSEDYTIKSFDLKTLKEDTFEEIIEIEANAPGKMCGLCTYFELELAEGVTISNSPFDEQVSYMQRIFTPADSIYLQEGDRLKVKVFYDGNYRLVFAE